MTMTWDYSVNEESEWDDGAATLVLFGDLGDVFCIESCHRDLHLKLLPGPAVSIISVMFIASVIC